MMQSSLRKVVVGTLFFVASCVVAIVGYMLAGWSIDEAVYMVTITIFGVGYGEVRPIDDPALRMFTMLVIISGCTSSIYVMGGFVQLIAEGELNRFLGARRMTHGIERLSEHVIVCGYGRVGRILANELARSGQQFVLIDTNQERLQEAEASGLYVIVGDATEERILESAGIAKARVLATVLPDDTANVFITLTARELNSSIEIIARGESPSTEKKLLRSGATRVVLPAVIGAARIARLIARPSVEDILSNSHHQESITDDLEQMGVRMMELPIPPNSDLAGREAGSISFGPGIQFVLIAVRSSDGTVNRDSPATYRVQPGDTLIVLTPRSTELDLQRVVKPREMIYRGARA